jgi:glycine cleavage system H protein
VLVPSDLRYSADHQWALVATDGVRVGITDYAQDALGDVQFVELPSVGTPVAAGAPVAEVESMKSVSEVSAPIAGVVIEVNMDLHDTPGLVNSDPYGAGWILLIQPTDPSATDTLLDAASYQALTEE